MLPRVGSPTPMVGLTIGLVNNIAPAARLRATQQFTRVVTAAAAVLGLRMTLFAVEELAGRVEDVLGTLRARRPDGLIVTGAEPQGDRLADEPLWPAMGRLTDWAADHTVSAIWSCMAAHMAVSRLDGIARRPLPGKLSGVFACAKATGHKLAADMPASWPVPHSRHNDLDAAELRGKGYTILSHGVAAGVDSFVKPVGDSVFLLLQGHPEYDADSLLGEYRRDIRRFLAGRRASYPALPAGYFPDATAQALERLHARAGCLAPSALLDAIDAAVAVPATATWQRPAVQMYVNWLSLLAERTVARNETARWPTRLRRMAS